MEVQEALPPAGGMGAEPLNPCAAASSPQTSLRVRSTEDEDSPKGYRSPKPATPSGGAGRKALFAGMGGQLGVFDRLKKPLCFFSPFWFVYDIERFSSCVYDKDA